MKKDIKLTYLKKAIKFLSKNKTKLTEVQVDELIIMHSKVKTTKSNNLIPPTYDTTCNFFTPLETKLLTA